MMTALDDRLSRELQDSVTQALFSITLHARAAQMALQQAGLDPQGPIARNLAQVNTLTQGALAEMRALIFELRRGALGEEGLIAALQKQGAALSAREGVAVELQAPPERPALDPDVEEHLYRLAREALHNVIKHAAASHVLVRLEPVPGTPDGFLLEIRDDGVGFDAQVPYPGHLGLSSMADGARAIGGTLEIHSAPGRGTRVLVRVPGTAGTVADEPVRS